MQGKRIKLDHGAGINWHILAGGGFSAVVLMRRMATAFETDCGQLQFCVFPPHRFRPSREHRIRKTRLNPRNLHEIDHPMSLYMRTGNF